MDGFVASHNPEVCRLCDQESCLSNDQLGTPTSSFAAVSMQNTARSMNPSWVSVDSDRLG
jgi:hypothetical protein